MKHRKVCAMYKMRDGRVIKLRPLNKGDLDSMIPFANSFVRERKRNRNLGVTSMTRRMTRADEMEFLEKILEEMAKGRRISVAAFHGDRLVGHCDISGRPSPDERHTGLLGIVVVDGYRGMGLGERMMRIALAEASKLGIWMIELEVFATNASARSLYGKLGFKEVGVIPKKVLREGTSVDIVRMYIHLPHN